MKKTLLALVLAAAGAFVGACSEKKQHQVAQSIAGIVTFTNISGTSYSLPIKVSDRVRVLGPFEQGNYVLHFREGTASVNTGDYSVLTNKAGNTEVVQLVGIDDVAGVAYFLHRGAQLSATYDRKTGNGTLSVGGTNHSIVVSTTSMSAGIDLDGDGLVTNGVRTCIVGQGAGGMGVVGITEDSLRDRRNFAILAGNVDELRQKIGY